MIELEHLHAYADGELNPQEQKGLRDKISADPALQAELNAISNLKDLLKEKSSSHSADDCWKACVGRLNELDRANKVESFVSRYAWAMCLILFALVIGGRYAATDGRGATANAADLLHVFHSQGRTESPEERKLFSQILQNGKFYRSDVKVLEHVVGVANDVPVDKLVLADSEGELTCFAIQNNLNFEDASEVSVGNGMNGGIVTREGDPEGARLSYVIWNDSGRTFVVIAPRPLQSLAEATVRLGLKSTAN